MRSFPLLRQSSEEKTLNDLLWFGDYVDFGTFWDSLNQYADQPEIEFAFKFKHSMRYMVYNSAWRASKELRSWQSRELDCEFQLRQVAETSSLDSQIFSEYVLASEGNVATLRVDKELVIRSLVVNAENVLPFIKAYRLARQAKLLPSFLIHVDEDVLGKRLLDTLRSLAHHKTNEQSLENLAESLIYGSRDFVLAQLKTARLGDVWARRVQALSPSSPEVDRLQKTLFVLQFAQVFDTVNSTLSATFSNVRYITPLRATAERYYRHRAISVDEIAPNGDNVAMFLKSLSDSESVDFANWTAEHKGFSVLVESHAGHVSILIEDKEDRSRVNLADVGFGYSQVIPILAQVWQITKKRKQPRQSVFLTHGDILGAAPIIFLIEQPELHLHPRMQGRLMELFYKVILGAKNAGIDLRLIIETHSETMVAKIGAMIAGGPPEAVDVGVFIFERDLEGAPVAKIRASKFDADGLLSNWPYDFFDGSSN